MNNIRYSINEIIRKPCIFLMIVGQVLIATMILISTLGVTLEMVDTVSKTKDLFNNKEVYQLQNDTSIGVNTSSNIEDSYELYCQLKNSDDFSAFSTMDSNMIIENFTDEDEFYYGTEENKYLINPYKNVEGEFSNIKSYYVDSEYWSEFPLSVMEGRSFEEEDFDESDVTPIILGASYNGIYSVGDEFRYFDYLSLKEKTAQVVGILEENTYVYSALGSMDLGDRIIYPMSNITLDNATTDKLQYWFNGCMVETNNAAESIKEIREESSSLNLYDFELVSCQEQMNLVVNLLSKSAKSAMALSGVILLFICIGIITVQLNSIKEREEEYGIHLLSGARKKDIELRCIYTTAIYIGLGMILGIYFQYYRNKDVYGIYYDSRILIILLILFICLITIIAVIPYKRIKKIEINNILRRLSE